MMLVDLRVVATIAATPSDHSGAAPRSHRKVSNARTPPASRAVPSLLTVAVAWRSGGLTAVRVTTTARGPLATPASFPRYQSVTRPRPNHRIPGNRVAVTGLSTSPTPWINLPRNPLMA
jgi:hypothetical protein